MSNYNTKRAGRSSRAKDTINLGGLVPDKVYQLGKKIKPNDPKRFEVRKKKGTCNCDACYDKRIQKLRKRKYGK